MVLTEFLNEWNSASPTISVHTSGSTGKPKLFQAEKKRMLASAKGTCDFLGLKSGDTALLCMSLEYIGAKMMVVRSVVRNMRLLVVGPSGHPLKSFVGKDTRIDFCAMVPLQVFNSLQVPEERKVLMNIRQLIIGGGAIDDAIVSEIRNFPHAIWSTYGMTETLSHIALRRLNGDLGSDWYTPFDTVSVNVNADHCLVIDAPLVCGSVLTTNDIAEMNQDGRRFRIIGRRDNTIDSGGVKIQAEEVERKLRPLLPYPFIVTKRKDAKYGEIVTLLIASTDKKGAEEVCKSILPKYWQPQLVISVDQIPATGSSKPDRAAAYRIAASYRR